MTPEELEYFRKWRKENPDKVKATRLKHEQTPGYKEYRKEYYATEKWRTYQREKMKAYRATPNGARACKNQDLKKKHGIGIDEYEGMVKAQNGGCAICGHVPGLDDRSLHVDHNHATGKIRGLLCHSCNTRLGLLEDERGLLEKCLEYLKKYE